MSKTQTKTMPVEKARKWVQTLCDTSFDHLLDGESAMFTLSALEKVLEHSDYLKELIRGIDKAERPIIWARSGKCRPNARHAGSSSDKPSDSYVSKSRFETVPGVTGYSAATGESRREWAKAEIAKADAYGVTSVELATIMGTTNHQASSVLSQLYLDGEVHREPIPNRRHTDAYYRYFPKVLRLVA